MSETPAAAQAPAFSRTAITLVVGAIAASFIGMLVLTAFLDDIVSRPSAAPDGYSVSALGHRGLVEVLRDLDMPVVVSRSRSGSKARDGLLVIAEPGVAPGDDQSADKLRKLVASADRVLVILPKWYGSPSAKNRRWVDVVRLLDPRELDAVLEALGVDGQVTRFVPSGEVDDELGLGTPDFRVSPDITLAQLVTDTDAGIWYSIGDGGLVLPVFVGDTQVTIVSDPDIFNTAGLARPGNAGFAVALIDELRRGGPVIFDETLHGFAEEPSLWKALFRFPLVLVTLHVTLLMLVVVWAGVGRFGPARSAPPALAAGKEYLVRNTAALLRVAGHHAHALERYLAAATEAVRHELHAPRDLSPADLAAWFERMRVARGGSIGYGELRDEVAEAIRTRNARAVLAAADRVHRWRMEMTHGPRHHS
jgi:hypothetical protein